MEQQWKLALFLLKRDVVVAQDELKPSQAVEQGVAARRWWLGLRNSARPSVRYSLLTKRSI